MGPWEKLWYYCPMPIKRRRSFFQKAAITLHLPPPNAFEKLHFIRTSTSLVLTASVFYFSFFFLSVIMDGTTKGIGILEWNPLLLGFSIPAFIFIWIGVDFLLSVAQAKGTKLVLLIILLIVIIPAGLAQSLNSGLFDVVTLTDDSHIDLHRCIAFVSMKNDGPKDVVITRVEVANIINYSEWTIPLKSGESYTLELSYLRSSIYYGPDYLSAGISITPTTFREQKYPVVVYTEGALTYNFEIPALFSEHEMIEGIHAETTRITQAIISNQTVLLPNIIITFSVPPRATIVVYSIKIGNLTLTLDYPSTIRGLPVYNSHDLLYQLGLYLVDEQYVVDGTSTFPTVVPNSPLASAIFTIGQTYDVTVRTMENNNYTTTVTLTE